MKVLTVYCLPKLHKTPCKHRFISSSIPCSTNKLFILLSSTLDKFMYAPWKNLQFQQYAFVVLLSRLQYSYSIVSFPMDIAGGKEKRGGGVPSEVIIWRVYFHNSSTLKSNSSGLFLIHGKPCSMTNRS